MNKKNGKILIDDKSSKNDREMMVNSGNALTDREGKIPERKKAERVEDFGMM